MSTTRLLAMSRKEVIQLRRDPRSMALAFLLPMALIVFFGYAISYDVKNIKMAVLDQNRTQASRSLSDAFESSGYFDVTERMTSYDQVERILGSGAALVALVIPRTSAATSLPAGRHQYRYSWTEETPTPLRSPRTTQRP